MNAIEHKRRHLQLNDALNELITDFKAQHQIRISMATLPVLTLMQWAARQADKPSHEDPKITIRKGRESV